MFPFIALLLDIDYGRRAQLERPASAGRKSADYAQDVIDGKVPRPKSAGYGGNRRQTKVRRFTIWRYTVK